MISEQLFLIRLYRFTAAKMPFIALIQLGLIAYIVFMWWVGVL